MREQLDLPSIRGPPESADGSSPPVALRMRVVRPLELELEESSNTMVTKLTLEYGLQWEDPRLFGSPCRAVLPELLSKKAGAASDGSRQLGLESFEDLAWLPKLSFGSQMSGEVRKASFGMNESTPWWAPVPSQPAEPKTGQGSAQRIVGPGCASSHAPAR